MAAPAAAMADLARRPPPVRFEGVGKYYPDAATPALADVDLTVLPGEICGIIGRSGAGKSTLLRLINRLEAPTSGRVCVSGVDIGALPERELVRTRRRIGMIFQHFNLLSAKTVWENVALPLKVAGVPKPRIRERTAELLQLVALGEHRDAYPAQLSGGQKQRVGIARALVHEPQILLCDEATSALDPETTESILDLIHGINRSLGLTIVLITHEMSVIRAICDRVVVLERGRIVETGTATGVLGHPRHEVTRALLAPLVHKLPRELTERLHPTPPEGAFDAVLDLRFSDDNVPDLMRIAAALGGATHLLYGNFDRVQAQVQGRLVLAVATRAEDLEAMLHRARSLADTVGVLGYGKVP